MGTNSSKEGRRADLPASPTSPQPNTSANHASTSGRPNPRPVYSAHHRRGSRPDLSFLGIGTSSNNDVPERRETKQEREKRKLEKERVAREKERERSIKEEHVDGGCLVTMGVYTGPEDFSKPVVRQMMV